MANESVPVITRYYTHGYTVKIGNGSAEYFPYPYWHGKSPFVKVKIGEYLRMKTKARDLIAAWPWPRSTTSTSVPVPLHPHAGIFAWMWAENRAIHQSFNVLRKMAYRCGLRFAADSEELVTFIGRVVEDEDHLERMARGPLKGISQ